MIDTHCHLNFQAFDGIVGITISNASAVGVTHFVVPGTDVESSKQAVAIAQKYDNVYAAVGIHPHHVFDMEHGKWNMKHLMQEINKLEKIINSCPIVAIGEIGLDRHLYKKTKYKNYHINESFFTAQKELFAAQLQLAKKYKKSVIIHNRETKKEMLEILEKNWDPFYAEKTVFHCCEPDMELLDFAKQCRVLMGVDGDVTYRKDKQEFIKKVPLEMLVLETDSPFLVPEPLRADKNFLNTPASLPVIAQFIADLKGEAVEKIAEAMADNAKRLFNLV